MRGRGGVTQRAAAVAPCPQLIVRPPEGALAPCHVDFDGPGRVEPRARREPRGSRGEPGRRPGGDAGGVLGGDSRRRAASGSRRRGEALRHGGIAPSCNFNSRRRWSSSIARWPSPCTKVRSTGSVSSTKSLARNELASYHLAYAARADMGRRLGRLAERALRTRRRFLSLGKSRSVAFLRWAPARSSHGACKRALYAHPRFVFGVFLVACSAGCSSPTAQDGTSGSSSGASRSGAIRPRPA